jgi:hypothetical protein
VAGLDSTKEADEVAASLAGRVEERSKVAEFSGSAVGSQSRLVPKSDERLKPFPESLNSAVGVLESDAGKPFEDRSAVGSKCIDFA